ncbi:MAG TPA: hypothetical protein VGC42_10130 [Kofleriaceae bacterium]
MIASRICGLAALLTSLTLATAAPRPRPSATGAFEHLRALVGNWAAPLPGGKSFRASFRLVANDTALVETYTSSSGKETLTIYTVDNDRLLATHYCAQGNQPRLALSSDATSTLAFDFLDATNLRDPSASHLHHLELTPNHDELIETEIYRASGHDEPERFVFKRTP